jgi:hypothetical protein
LTQIRPVSSPLHFGSICSGLIDPHPPYAGVSTTTTDLPQSGLSGAIDIIVVALTNVGVAPTALGVTIATI